MFFKMAQLGTRYGRGLQTLLRIFKYARAELQCPDEVGHLKKVFGDSQANSAKFIQTSDSLQYFRFGKDGFVPFAALSCKESNDRKYSTHILLIYCDVFSFSFISPGLRSGCCRRLSESFARRSLRLSIVSRDWVTSRDNAWLVHNGRQRWEGTECFFFSRKSVLD